MIWRGGYHSPVRHVRETKSGFLLFEENVKLRGGGGKLCWDFTPLITRFISFVFVFCFFFCCCLFVCLGLFYFIFVTVIPAYL